VEGYLYKIMKINKSLINGSIILLITFNIFNVINFIFQFSMARLLTIAEFGVLATLSSIIFIFAVFSHSIQLIVTKYTSSLKQKSQIKNIFKRTLRKSMKFSVLVFILYLILIIPFSILLKISYPLMALTGVMIFGVFLVPISRGILQGRKQFTSLGTNMIVEGGVKLILAISLVLIGWQVYGAIISIVIGAFAAFFLSLFSFKDILKSKEKKVKTPEIYQYSRPIFFTLLTIMLFYSLDVIIAKAVFEESIAGMYAISSTLAKIIFIGTMPISNAMFPISAMNNKNKKTSKSIISNAFGILGVLVVLSLIVIYLFSDPIVSIFSVPEATKILFNLAIGTSLLSITNLVLLHKLSINKMKNYGYLLIVILLQIALLSIFSGNLITFSVAYIVSSLIFLITSIFLLK